MSMLHLRTIDVEVTVIYGHCTKTRFSCPNINISYADLAAVPRPQFYTPEQQLSEGKCCWAGLLVYA